MLSSTPPLLVRTLLLLPPLTSPPLFVAAFLTSLSSSSPTRLRPRKARGLAGLLLLAAAGSFSDAFRLLDRVDGEDIVDLGVDV